MNERKRFSRRSRVWAGAAAVGLVAVVGVVSGGVGRTSRAEALQGRYVALGDSIAFGYSPLLEDPWIPERFVGYPELIAEQRGLSTTNLACPGQTAQALVSRTAVDAGCFDARRAARDAGFALLHTDYSGTQLQAALDAVRSDRQVSLISIQGGGNEISLCLDRPAKFDRCVADAVPKVAGSLRQAVTQLRAAGYQGRVVLVGYHLVPGLEAPLRRLNGAIERAARDRHVAFADAAVPFDRYAQQHHGDLCTAGLLVVLPDGSCDLHPSRIGQGLYADAVLDAASGSGLASGTA
jgi:lysophospholipase L1-like esterase